MFMCSTVSSVQCCYIKCDVKLYSLTHCVLSVQKKNLFFTASYMYISHVVFFFLYDNNKKLYVIYIDFIYEQ